MRNWLAVPALVLLAACGAAASFWVTIAFPDQEARERTSSVDVFALSPAGDAGCQALIDGSAKPGDNGYTIEDEVSIDYPSLSGARALANIGPGQRLFFARAGDSTGAVILRGCSDQLAGGGSQQEVTIQLWWACRPTNGGVEICDGLDNDCDGQTDDGDPAFLCPGVAHAAATECSGGRCNYGCDEGFVNANGEWSDGCECRPTRQGVEWCDGLDNDCDGQVDGSACTQCLTDSDCIDSGSCLEGACGDGVCSTLPSADGTSCDDGLYCSVTDTCQAGECLGEARDCGSLDDQCNVGVCYETSDACLPQTLDDGTPCDDGLYCGIDDGCLAGVCTGDARDCSAEDSDCLIGTCNEGLKICEGRAKLNGTPCASDGTFCNGAEECQAGTCSSPGNPCPVPADCDEASGFCAGCGDGVVSVNEDCDPAAPSGRNCCDPATCLWVPYGGADPQAVCSADLECQSSACDGAGGCALIDLPDGTPCQDDGMFCTGQEACQSGSCASSGNPCPGADADADCNESCNESLDNCSAFDGDGSACDDGDICTQADACMAGACQAQALDCSVLDGECVRGVCSPVSGLCEEIFDTAGTSCDDGIGCTTDICDGLGVCLGTPDDGLCAPGSYCLPACTTVADGCLAPPVLSVDCGDVVVGASAACQIVTSPATPDLVSCLQCTAHLLEPELSRVDFSDQGGGVCDLGGWQVEGGNYCQNDLSPHHCPLNAQQYGPDNCCSNLVCPVIDGPLSGLYAMQADEGTCAGSFEEYRLFGEFDLRAFDMAGLCFDVAQDGCGLDDYFQVQQGTGSPDGTTLDCFDGNEPQNSGDLSRHCVDLASWGFSEPLLRLDLWTHSENPGDSWIIDNISLVAGYQNCQPTTRLVFEEHFDSCPLNLSDGYNGWTIVGNQVRCESYRCVNDGLHNDQDSWAIEHAVDTSALAGPVNLCWTMGGEPNTDALVAVEFNTGTGWQPAYSSSAGLTLQDECLMMCIDLASIDPAAASNPDLLIRFTVDSLNNYVLLDDITVGGDARCDSANTLQTSPITEQAGQYWLDVDNLGGKNYPVQVECSLSVGGQTIFTTDDFSYSVE
ncbi:MAG TPA: MopE-related protein [Myxococcota bacterium]|nr:MopE-related protein [Myxococcota bacterium]